MREPLNTVSRMRPKVVELNVVVGNPNDGVLVRLVLSARITRLYFSAMDRCLAKEASNAPVESVTRPRRREVVPYGKAESENATRAEATLLNMQ